MRFTPQTHNTTLNLIRGYGDAELRVNQQVFHVALILNANALFEEPGLRTVADLGDTHIERVLTLTPDVVLLGTGRRQLFPDAVFGARFLRAGIGFEVMDTGAACRTYNVLVSEQRNVAAILLP